MLGGERGRKGKERRVLEREEREERESYLIMSCSSLEFSPFGLGEQDSSIRGRTSHMVAGVGRGCGQNNLHSNVGVVKILQISTLWVWSHVPTVGVVKRYPVGVNLKPVRYMHVFVYQGRAKINNT